MWRARAQAYGPGMNGTAAPESTSHKAPDGGAPGAGQVFLGDARLAVAALNEGRHVVLTRVFGVPRAEANLLTFVLVLGAASGASATARRVVRPLALSRSDAGMGGFLVREAVLGVAGPSARKVPFAGTLLTAAMLGALVPGLRRTVHGIQAAELRIRRQRMSAYAARRAARDRGDAA
jgi:hypothetical protein